MKSGRKPSRPIGVMSLAIMFALAGAACSEENLSGSADFSAEQASGNGRVAPPPGGTGMPDLGSVPTVAPDGTREEDVEPGPSEDAVSAGPDGTTAEASIYKNDDLYLVPAGVALRSRVAAGPGVVAWVERAAPGAEPELVVWRVSDEVAPERLRVPYLSNPMQLVVSASWLVYVDDRYGDPDIFAIDLATGLEQAVVTEVGAQLEPALRGSVVAWRDCRTCVLGAPVAADIYRLDLGQGAAEQRLTNGPEDERRPALGQLADGSEATVWLEGESRIRVAGEGASEAWDVESFVSTVSITTGYLTWREQTGVINPDSMKPVVINPDSMKPAGVINPDSMIPSDVYGTLALTGKTEALSVHAELSPEIEGAVHAAGGRAMWVEANAALDFASRVVVADVTTGDVDVVIDVTGVWSPALADDLVVFVAPRDDNDGNDDIWVHLLQP